jgi:hypothetical protein
MEPIACSVLVLGRGTRRLRVRNPRRTAWPRHGVASPPLAQRPASVRPARLLPVFNLFQVKYHHSFCDHGRARAGIGRILLDPLPCDSCTLVTAGFVLADRH